MCRTAVLTALAFACFATEAVATEQIREQIVVAGRVQRMEQVPLLQWFPGRDFPWPKSERLTSSCWRGYVGRWLLENDRLYLLSVSRMAKSKSGWADVPIEKYFGKAPPVPADWYSGELKLPLGNAVGRDHGIGYYTIFPRTLQVEIVKGRVTSQRVIDNRTERAHVRSFDDLRWVADSPPPPDDLQWHDARLIDTQVFRKEVPKGTPFRTRGLLMSINSDMSLFIPDSPLTPPAGMDLVNVPKIEIEPYSSPPVEVTGTWNKGEGRIVIDVSAVRKLKPGETIHHPKFPVPADAEARMRKMLEKKAWKVDSIRARNVFMGDFVRVEGTLRPGARPKILGIVIAGDPTLAGRRVRAYGVLERWWVTPHLLKSNVEVAMWVAGRGPGEYFRLVDPFNGELARPEAAP